MDDLKVIFEDNHIIVVVKEANLLSQADVTKDIDLTEIVKKYLKEKYNKPGNVYLGLINRLDRRVGGLMVCAKTSKASIRLSEDLRNHKFDKEYYAIVKGKIEVGILEELTDYLEKDEKNHLARITTSSNSKAKIASLKYKSIKNIVLDDTDFTLLEVKLITGRYNQIRVQLASRGYPIINDYKYSYRGNNYDNTLGLWCKKIGFFHPVTKEKMEFEYVDKTGIWSLI